MKSPAFQWYPGDYLGSQRVQLMTLEEEGAYMRLLCYCWLHGSVPSDPAQAARLIGKGASTTLATTVLSMFEVRGAVMVHDRLEEEREKQAKWREKSSAGGRKSAESRAKALRSAKLRSPMVVQPPLQGSLANGANQTSTLQSSSSSSDLFPSAVAEDRRHHDITRRWNEVYRGAFGVDYGFTGRDAATLKRFLGGVRDSAEDILTVAVRAWERAKQDRFAKRCKEAASIHGLCTYFNEIRVELQTPTSHANDRPSNSRGFSQQQDYAGVTEKL